MLVRPRKNLYMTKWNISVLLKFNIIKTEGTGLKYGAFNGEYML
jgi:hypothetical protein